MTLSRSTSRASRRPFPGATREGAVHAGAACEGAAHAGAAYAGAACEGTPRAGTPLAAAREKGALPVRPHPHAPFRQDPSSTAAFAALPDLKENPQIAAGLGGREPKAQAGMRAVVIGGGTGAPVSIKTLLSLGATTSAVVAMADDGGSTGILREEADATTPGDVRKCIAAFARDPSDPLTRAFKYRFSFARNHTLGNLMLAALEEASGSFPEAIRICERLLDAQGHVYPSTLDHVNLVAKTRDGRILEGQANACASRTALERVWLTSEQEPRPYRPAVKAIENADLIVLGPGSLFTSIIPNLLVPGIIDAIRSSRGCVLFVCSLADMQGETWGLTAREHVEALACHGMRGLIDYVLVHTPVPLRPDSPATDVFNAVTGSKPENASLSDMDDAHLSGRIRPVPITYHDVVAIQKQGPVVIARNLVDAHRPTWHDPQALRDAFLGVMKLCRSRWK